MICAKNGRCPNLVGYASTLLTSVGIFGTFAGVVIGLMDFDPSNIDQSIEALLNGLKTAFITSLYGMLASIIYKFYISIFITENSYGDSVNVGVEDIYRVIKVQNESIQSLKDSIAGEDDSTLIGQVKLMRSDVNDYNKLTLDIFNKMSNDITDLQEVVEKQRHEFNSFTEKLWIKLQDFADMLSKSATETVINALKEVISDFNDNLIEQFGDNFKQLNIAVEQLVVWQDNYKHQIESMTEQYKLGVESIEHTKSSVEAISVQSENIPLTMELLKKVIDVNQAQIEELSRHLDAFKDIRDRAVDAVPEIRRQVSETVDSVSKSTIHAGEFYKQLLSDTESTLEAQASRVNDICETFTKNTNEGIESVGVKLNESAIKVEGAINEGVTDFTSKVHQTNASLQSTSDHLSSQSEEIKNHLKDTVSDLNSNIRGMVESLVSGSENINNTLSDSSKIMESSSLQMQEKLSEATNEVQDRLENLLSDIFKAQAQEINRTFDALEKELQSQVGKTGEAVEGQLKIIDQSMNQEIERVMQAMGEALARITGQFTKDYSRLVEGMSAVVNRKI